MACPVFRAPPPARCVRLLGWLLAGVATLAAAGRPEARAGGGPENLFLVVNSTSSDSLAVANAFVAARGIPPINVFMLPWAGSKENTTLARFREELLMPILRAIDSRLRSTASSTPPTSPGGSTTPRHCRRSSPKKTRFRPHP